MSDNQQPLEQKKPRKQYRGKVVEEKRGDLANLRNGLLILLERIDRVARMPDWSLKQGNKRTAALNRQSFEVTELLLELRRNKVEVENVIELPTLDSPDSPA